MVSAPLCKKQILVNANNLLKSCISQPIHEIRLLSSLTGVTATRLLELSTETSRDHDYHCFAG